ncbi:serine/threonine protein kinase [Frankia sp. EI5c]|uniref:protein kinase domain-containing protein n=1 Tax=Frankia sp. EI5c TaxID=683316 RepID=UPI0007C20243|nr:protein kinase [Frankia sp. EI5c]OAA20032.1 serine/threonine protein kinase [Frankia sp. EI5c]
MLTPLTKDDPARIGPYRLANRIGAGGMGVVYLGFAHDGRPAAVKVPSAALVDDPEFRTRFRQEVAAASRVRGNAVAAVLDADPTGPTPWLATEYVEGRSLAEAVRDRGPLAEHLVVAAAVGLADALVAIHAAGVVHRDLKPANILLAWDGPRVIDFGIARDAATTSLTQTGSLVGTLAWMAPEQLRGERAGPAADIFAWGSCVAFAAAGRSAFRGDQAQAVALQILSGEPVIERLPPTVERQVRAALRKDPAARPSAAQILANLLDRTPGTPTEHVEPGQLVRQWWHEAPAPGGPGAAPLARTAVAGAGYGSGPTPQPGPRPPDRRRTVPVTLLVVLALVLTAGGATAGALLTARNRGEVPGTDYIAASGTGSPATRTSPAPTAPRTSAPRTSAAPSDGSPTRVLSAAEAGRIVRNLGYTPDLSTYDRARPLNLVRGTRESGGRHQETAFVFAGGEYRGTDTRDPSTRITTTQTSDVDVTINYQTYAAGGTTPTGATAVRFHWDGRSFTPLDEIPSADPAVSNHR